MHDGDRLSPLRRAALLCLILLGTAAAPIPALADTIQYTYTSSPLLAYVGNYNAPAPPSWVGNELKITFTTDGYLLPMVVGGPAEQGTGEHEVYSFTISCGPLSIESEGPMCIYTDTSGGITGWLCSPVPLPLTSDPTNHWYITMRSAANWHHDGSPTFDEVAFNCYVADVGSGSNLDGHLTDGEYWDLYNRNSPGSWSAVDVSQVPVPATALLLGSGLIPLAWARRKKRCGE